uniref:Retrotransposon protein, putative, Ty1-copia subclass n=1 Tax=Tanacetum cinerariifolium TaxID=118510 RepID=A0A6L2LZN5_TANCI|nr:hypothetical protein [Tanacetum cinerariifolium]
MSSCWSFPISASCEYSIQDSASKISSLLLQRVIDRLDAISSSSSSSSKSTTGCFLVLLCLRLASRCSLAYGTLNYGCDDGYGKYCGCDGCCEKYCGCDDCCEKIVVVYFLDSCNFGSRIVNFDDTPIFFAMASDGGVVASVVARPHGTPCSKHKPFGCRSMFEREKLFGNNFNDRFRQLKLVLRVKKKMYVIEQPLLAAPTTDSAANVLAEWNAIYDAYNEMKGYVDQLERLGYMLPQDIIVGLILNGLAKDFVGFVRNYNMHNLGKTIGELHAMLIEYEKGLPKKAETPQVIMIKGGKIYKSKKKSLKAKGKGKANSKENDKQVYIPKTKNPKLAAKEHPAKEDTCYHCKEVGHWKRNYLVYLAGLLKKKKQVGSVISSSIFTIELFAFPNKSWVYDTGCGNGVRTQVEAIGSFDLVSPNGLVICLYNCHYAPSITRGVVSVHRLVENRFVQCFMNFRILVFKNNVFYFNSLPSDGIYEIDMHDLVPNVNSIYNVSTKRAKYNLDSTYLWHCCLAHISKKRIEKLQQEGLLKSTDDESFDQCVSCLSVKMTRKSFPHRPERATGLFGIIHTDVCGPLRHVSRQGASYFITFTDDYSRYGYVYLLKHKHEGYEALVKRDTPDKLLQRSVKCILIGYPKETIGYYFYVPPENKIVVARYAEFIEKNIITQKVSGRAVDLEEIQDEDTSPFEINIKIPMEVEGFEPPQEEVILIRRFGFAQNLDDPCVYQKASGSNVTFLILYVDDIIIMGNHIPSLQSVKHYLGKCFAMKDLGEASFIYGIKIYRYRSKQLIGLGQNAYMDKILKRYKMDNSKRGHIPMKERLDLSKTQGTSTPKEVKRMQNVPYASAMAIMKFISRLGIAPTINEPIKMFCDNSAALLIARELGVQMGTRHYHRSNLLRVHTDDNLAYPFMKALPKGKLTQHARNT